MMKHGSGKERRGLSERSRAALVRRGSQCNRRPKMPRAGALVRRVSCRAGFFSCPFSKRSKQSHTSFELLQYSRP